MNYPIWDLQGSGLLIAIVATVHVFVSHFAVGGGLFLVVTEARARKAGDDALLAYVRGHSRFFMLLTLVFGALTGVGIWFAIALVQPQATSALINTFVWGWAIEWAFFITEIAAAMVYYYGWDRLSARTHIVVGWIYFVAAWASLVVINGIITFMMTPGRWPETRSFWDGFFNETYWPSLVARTFVCIGLAGLYSLLTISVCRDEGLKQRVASYAGWRWVMPMALALPLSLLWYLASLMNAGIPAGKMLGAGEESLLAVVGALFGGAGGAGYPNAQRAVLVSLTASALVALLTLFLLLFRRRRFGLPLTLTLLVLGQLAFGGGEWLREDLRKPFVIGEYMFVNSVRLPPREGVPAPPAELAALAQDPYTVTALRATGVLAASRWLPAPDGFDSLSGPAEGMEPETHAALEAEAGRRVFRMLCSACHSIDGYMAITPLVEGQGVGALEKVIDSLARPVGPDGEPVAWNDPGLRLKTRLGRRMPPFAGSEAEKHALAVYLARLGGDPQAGLPQRQDPALLGAQVFEDNCAICHDADGDWPMVERVRGRGADEFFALIADLPAVNEVMDPFEGTDEERRAVAEYIAGLEE